MTETPRAGPQIDKFRMFNGVIQTAIATGMIGIGSMMVGLRDDNLVIKTEMEFLVGNVKRASASQYTRDQANSDWKFQDAVNADLHKSMLALSESEAKDMKHMSLRIDRLENQTR